MGRKNLTKNKPKQAQSVEIEEIESVEQKSLSPTTEELPSPKKGLRKESIEIVEQSEKALKSQQSEEDLPKKLKRGISATKEDIDIVEQSNTPQTPTETKDNQNKKLQRAISARKESIEIKDITEETSAPQTPVETDNDNQKRKLQRGLSARKESIEIKEITDQSSIPQTPGETDYDNQKKKLQRGISARKESIEISEKTNDDSNKEALLGDIEKPKSQKGKLDSDFIDEEMESLLKRSERQRSLVEDISQKPEGIFFKQNHKLFYNGTHFLSSHTLLLQYSFKLTLL